MFIFKSLKEFLDYIPSCFICEKPLFTRIKFKTVVDQHSKILHLNVRVNDSTISCFNKEKTWIVLNFDNSYLVGQDMLTQPSVAYASKSCATCHLKIKAESNKLNNKNFPSLLLREEELHLTMRGGQDLKINKTYYSNPPTSWITLNYQSLPPIQLDFDKFKSLEQLKNRINTIKTFH